MKIYKVKENTTFSIYNGWWGFELWGFTVEAPSLWSAIKGWFIIMLDNNH